MHLGVHRRVETVVRPLAKSDEGEQLVQHQAQYSASGKANHTIANIQKRHSPAMSVSPKITKTEEVSFLITGMFKQSYHHANIGILTLKLQWSIP